MWSCDGELAASTEDLLAARGQRHTSRLANDASTMNPALADFILAKTPDRVLETVTMAPPSFTLNTGASIPAIGLGTWQSDKGLVKDAVSHALKHGYRHIDAALVYQNENEVGQGLKEGFATGIKREDVFVTTKLWNTFHRKVEEGINKSLESLGLDYVDLLLMHWPVPMNGSGNDPLFPKLPDGSRDLDKDWSYVQTWHEMEKLLKTGKVRAIGVSNFSVKFLESLLKEAKVVPAVNQVENHPYLPQQDIVDFCKSKGIVVEAYSPLGSTGSPLFEEKVVKQLAEKYSVGPGTILINYQVARGIVVLPKSTTKHRIEENLRSLELADADVQALSQIHKDNGVKRFVYPAFGVNLGFPVKQ